ncbi:hypothetical protein ACHAWO_007871 [Cyclotella atomus]|uniref:Peptidase C14 caspase domain-containing protein n=1 Tax=Cyclotella atomus TaxID=382360 RepID=A0ABD3MYY2_9STRA
MSYLIDDDMGTFLDLPDISSDLGRLEPPTGRPTPAPTPFPTEVSTPVPTEIKPEPTPLPTPSPVEPSAEPTVDYIKTLAPITPNPTDVSTTAPTDAPNLVEPQELAQQKSYFSCPAPAPKMILSEDENGVPINIMIDPPIASCQVSYDFELTLDETNSATMETDAQALEYIQSLLPGIGDRLGESVANYLTLNTEYGSDETKCKGYLVDEWRIRRMQQHRLRAESTTDELTIIISLQSQQYTVDGVDVCNPPARGCYVVNGKINATYVGYDEPGVKSTVSRLVKDEMDADTPTTTVKGHDRTEMNYSLKYLGPSGDVLAQAPATPSAIISMEDITDYIPTTEFSPTPIGIGIIAALSAAFVMMCYSACSRDKELKEEVIDEVEEIKCKLKKGKSSKKKKKHVPLATDDASESDSGYDLESVAIDVKGDGENDSQEAVEISGTVSFGHDAAMAHMAREEKKPKFSLAAAVNTIPRVEPFRPSRDIRKKNSSSRAAASRSAKLASEISADIRMISGCADAQTSADANITAFQLPDPAGRSGGACTAALLEALYKKKSGSQSWAELLQEIRSNLTNKGYDQIPQLTSSSVIDVNEPMELVPNTSGTKRALLIGINYTGQEGELSGCHNDVKHIAQYLQKVHGFKKQNMTVLLDNGKCEEPTYANIMMTLERIARESQPGDTVWLHYSGHGGRLPDDSGEEEDGMDETIIPLDFKRRGQIRDDDLLRYFVKPMKRGVTVTCIMDCCHSGTVLDLPYQFIGDGEHSAMESNRIFFKGPAKTDGTTGAGSRSILEDLEATNHSNPSRSSPRRSESLNNVQTLPSVRETDLPPPTHDTPSHRSKWSRLISPTAVNEFDHDVIRTENSQGEEQYEV